ncbi:MAG TPA: YfhO family protein [Acidimicrobiales bacterium]|nr:YfhO family protein [Acidimicrobiales bacterium]
MNFRKSAFIRLFVLCVAPLAAFADRLLSGRVIAPDDGSAYFLPLHLLAARHWAAGHLPVWNPNSFAGIPLLGMGQVGAFYPPNLLFLVASPALANNALVMLDFAVAAIGAFLLARRLTGDETAALTGGLCFALSGFMFGHLSHQNLVASAAWLPWVLFGYELLRERLSSTRLLLGGGALALALLAGHAQVFLIALLMVGTYAAAITALEFRDQHLRPLLLAGLVVVVGVGLSAVQLLPTANVVSASGRAAVDYATATSYSFPLSHLPLLLFPNLFGTASPSGPLSFAYAGSWTMAELNGYPGMAALVLAAVGLRVARHDRRVVAFVGLGALGLLMATGAATPFGRVVYAVPPFGQFRSWARYIVLLDLAVAMLAAYGVASLRSSDVPRRWRAVLPQAFVPMLALLVLVTMFAVRSAGAHIADGRTVLFAITSPLAFAIGGVVCSLSLVRGTRTSAWVVPAVVALDLIVTYGTFSEWRGKSPTIATVTSSLSPTTTPTFGAVADQPGGIDRFMFAGPYITRLSDYPEITGAKGLRSANGYEPLAPTAYLQAAGNMNYFGAIYDTRPLLAAGNHTLDLLRVTTVITPPVVEPSVLEGPGHEIPGTGLVRYDYRPRLPDVFVVGEVRRGSRADALAGLVGADSFDPAATAVIETDCETCARANRPGSVATVQATKWESGALTVDLVADRAGLMVASQSWSAGWTATVDGRPAPVVRTNALVQGVPVAAGFHRVRLSYEPPGLRLGAGVSFGTLIVLVMSGVARRRKRFNEVHRGAGE